MSSPPPTIRSGQIAALRLFDIAYAIDLTRAETLAARPGGERARLASTPPKAVAFDVPPLLLPLGPATLELDGTQHQAQARVRLYDFGIAAFELSLAVTDLAWPAFVDRANAFDRAVGPAANAPVWAGLLATLRAEIGPALDRASSAILQEDYLLATIHAFDPPLNATEAEARIDLIPLLSGETRPLSAAARQGLLRQRFSYFEDDLVILTWDRAVLIEPRRETDVADVLELVNAQLLEMRYYDERLDDELPRMYDLVEAARRTTSLLAARRYAALARRLTSMVAEVTEVTEKVDNALQVTEDVYLARVYAAAIDTLRVPAIGAAVDRKVAIMRDTYTALYSESHANRAEVLEISILVLIALEIVLSIVR
ncbi:hypothetical protein [Plastoroseomonas arctica]|uniref:DUF155 domain-containing protein n=1 Tax=Plastoroseomonas arctica TaxID=1509237 RepID=A0AAF1K5I6_9PROT|nr:hypothetical protein [Plastoroseomonas arctica]MBR0656600.1 hypothetical protein [Plastoroseomonas arctica]